MVQLENSFSLFEDEESDAEDILKRAEEEERARKAAEKQAKEVARMAAAIQAAKAEWAERVRKAEEEKPEAYRLAEMVWCEDESGEILLVSPQRYGNGTNETQVVVDLENKPQNENTKEKDRHIVTKVNGYKSNGNRNQSYRRGGRSFGNYNGERNDTNNGNVAESIELPMKAKNATDALGEVEVEETEEQKEAKEARLEKQAKWLEDQARRNTRMEEKALEATQMTLKQYEEILAEKKKALEDKAKKVEERKVTLDHKFENMSLVGKKAEEKPVIDKSNKLQKKNPKVQRISIDEFHKQLAEKADELSESQSARSEEQKQPSENEFKLVNGRGRQERETNSKNGEANSFRNGSNHGGYQRKLKNSSENASNRVGYQRRATNGSEKGSNRGGYQRRVTNVSENRPNHVGYQRATNGSENGSNRGGYQRARNGPENGPSRGEHQRATNGYDTGSNRGGYPRATNGYGNGSNCGGYQRERYDECNEATPNKTPPPPPPPIEDAEQFPNLTKAIKP